MKTGFRPLFKTALGVRNLIPGGGGGGGNASASPPAAPPTGSGGAAGAATLTAVESGGALGRGAADGGDADGVASLVRSVENASDAADVEDLQHPASTADNLDALARVDVEGPGGPQQVADIYDQPVPAAAASEPDAGPAPATRSRRRQPPPLDSTQPGAEGYDFQKVYGSLSDRNRFYRLDSDWRGNIYMREYLGALDSKAAALLEGVGGSTAGIGGDAFGYRTEKFHSALQAMADQAQATGRLDDFANIRAAMDELEELLNGTILQVAACTDEFSGAALGSQRVPIDPNIDTGKLRGWLEGQLEAAQTSYYQAENMANGPAKEQVLTTKSWECSYWIQLLERLDEGTSPLFDSTGQIALLRVEKIDPYYAKFADEVAAAAADGYEFAVPRTVNDDQLDLYHLLHDRLMATLSDPQFFRSAEAMDLDVFTPAVRARIEADQAFLGPASMGSPPRRAPPPLDPAAPGTEGYDFGRAFDSLDARSRFYRAEFDYRGSMFVGEYLRNIDARAIELFETLGRPADEIQGNSFGRRAGNVHRAMETMAGEAETAGDFARAADIRAAMDEIEELLNSTLANVAARTDEFSGRPIDRSIDKVRLRGWLQIQFDDAEFRADTLVDDEARHLAAREMGYYRSLIRAVDYGMDPLPVSNEMAAVLRATRIDPYYAKFADEVAAAAADGFELVVPRPPVQDELDLYHELQKLLIATIARPEYQIPAEAMGTDAFRTAARGFGAAEFDIRPDALRRAADADVPPPLPAASLSDDMGYIGRARDRSFPRSTLDAGEQTLERRVIDLAEQNFAARGGASATGGSGPEVSGTWEFPAASRRTPPDNAKAPLVDERTGRWVLNSNVQPDASRTPAGGAYTSAQGDATGVADVRCLVGFGASGVRRPESRSRRRQRRRCGPIQSLQGGIRAAGLGRRTARSRRGRRRILRLADRRFLRRGGRRREPHRQPLPPGRCHHHTRTRQPNRTGSFGHRFARHVAQARPGVRRRRPQHAGHRLRLDRRLGGGRGRGHRRHAFGPLLRAGVV